MSQEKSGDSAIARLYDRAQISLTSAQKELDALRSSLGVGGIKPGLGAIAAGNTACDSGCDGACGALSGVREAVINPAELKTKLTVRVSAVLDAHRALGTEALSKATSGNEACDSGCNSGCGGASLGDITTLPGTRT